MVKNPLAYTLLAVITAGYAATAALYAILTPPWQAPDEPAHYNYAAQIAEDGCCPVIAAGDWDAVYLEQLKAQGFPEDADLSAIAYEDWQPPLYYLIASAVLWAAGGSLLALRLLSAALGAGVVIAAYFAAARLLPAHKPLALAAAIFVGFLPQHVAILASANNDSLAGLLLGILIVIALGYLGNPVLPDYDGRPQPLDESSRPHAAAMGGFVGLICLTKLTPILPALLIVLLAIAWRWRIEGRPARWIAQQAAWGVGLGLLIALPWWARNAAVYGFPDVLGMAAHSRVVAGQLRTADLIGQVGLAAYLRQLITVTFHSFWGQFGWMGVPMPPRVYALLGAFSLWALIGLALAVGLRGARDAAPPQRAGFWLLIWTALAAAAVYLFYNLTFVQFQGRYLYAALIPIGIGAALGGWGWALALRRHLPERLRVWLPPAALAWMPALALIALFRYILPNLR